MNIAVIGSGYVGTTAAAIFALSGHSVTAIDIDQNKVDLINSGKAPFFEAGLDELIAEGIRCGSLTATTQYEDAVSRANVVLSCVGTPDNPDGSSNLEYIFDAANEAAEYLKPDAIYIQKSTVPVGTGREVIKHLPDSVAYVSNPEFLRESTAIYDTLMFDRVVAGGDDEAANQRVLELHKDVEKNANEIAHHSQVDYSPDKLAANQGEYISTRLESAELIKVTANAFLAMKITFANSIAKLADKTGADIDEVMSAVGSDARIGQAFFNASRGYGGGCFPKDVSGLIASAAKHGAPLPIMEAVQSVNDSMPGYIVDKLKTEVGDMSGKKVAVLGLAFKAGTSDVRKSPSIALTNLLVKQGAVVTAYDPEANDEAQKGGLSDGVILVDNVIPAVQNAEIVLVATDWPEFVNLDSWIDETNAQIIVDCMNSLDKFKLFGKTYIGVGKR